MSRSRRIAVMNSAASVAMAARGLAASLVVDPQPAVAREPTQGLPPLPAPLLAPDAPPVPDPDDLDGDAVPVEEGLGLLPGEAAVEPGQPQRRVAGEVGRQGAQRPVLALIGRDDPNAE